ncbi:MAG: MFS transporter [Gemmatimonadales bacterium]
MTSLRPQAPRLPIPVTRREIFGWAMFDFANSCYTTVVITLAYSKFFVSDIVPSGSRFENSYWSIAIILSTLVALVLSPLAGAIIDYSGRKKRALIASSIVCAIGTAMLALAGPGQVWLAIGLIVLSNAAFMMSEAFCASFLPELSTPKTMGKISGLGWGVGYLGGLLSAALTMLVIVRSDPAVDSAGYVRENQLAMIAMGAFFLIAALPTFALVRNRSLPVPGYERASWGALVRAGFKELRETAAIASRHRILFQFLVAFMVYMAGLDAIVKFVGIYAEQEVQLTGAELINLFIVLQLFAAGGALGFGWLEARIGPKRTVMATLLWWIVGVVGIYFMRQLAAVFTVDPKTVFYALGMIAGSGIGATQASSRTVVGLLAPPDRVAQMFGFWGMFSRLGSILGAVGFGLASDLFSRRSAVLVLVAFFALGAALLWRVDVERGVREAQGDLAG